MFSKGVKWVSPPRGPFNAQIAFMPHSTSANGSHQEFGVDVLTAEELIPLLMESKERIYHTTEGHRAELRDFLGAFLRRTYKPFPFLRLPRELRNRIYELVFVCSDPRVQHLRLPDIGSGSNKNLAIQPALSKVSRQLRTEALKVFYEDNTFASHIEYLDFTGLVEHLKLIGPESAQKMWLLYICPMFLPPRTFRCAEGLFDFVCWQAEFPMNLVVTPGPPAEQNVIIHALKFAASMRDLYQSDPNALQDIRARFDSWLKANYLFCECKRRKTRAGRMYCTNGDPVLAIAKQDDLWGLF